MTTHDHTPLPLDHAPLPLEVDDAQSLADDSSTAADVGDDHDLDATGAEPPRPTFADLGVQTEIADALADLGIVHPFPIQAMTLPVALSRHDIIGQAKTGTGKTLGFGIPMLMATVGPDEPGWDALARPGAPQGLVVVPTRELAVQVARDLERAAARRRVRVLTVYGGRAYEPQVEALKRGIEIVVGTPGRLLDLTQQRHLDLSHAKTVVLDEADEMLDLGFLPDVEKIFSMVASRRHTMLFSATMPGPVVALARRYMVQPTHIRASEPDDHSHVVRSITQRVYRAHAMDKVEMLSRMLQARERGLTMIFARTKRTAAKVADELGERGFAAAAIHGDLGQGAREQALRAFRNGKVDVLVATDVAARGIDVDDVTHVVNYQCPEDEKTYVHRIGRTGRAGKKGIAVTFVDWDDMPRWGLIDKVLGLGIPEPVETYSSSEHLFAELDIPADATGRLPRSQRTRAGLDAEQVEDLGETGKKHGGTSGRGRRERDRTRDGDRRPRGSGRDRDDQPSGADGEAPHARRRARRRTRGGKPLVAEPGSLETPAPDPAPGGAEAGEAKRRRRRRRGGRSIGAGAAE